MKGDRARDGRPFLLQQTPIAPTASSYECPLRRLKSAKDEGKWRIDASAEIDFSGIFIQRLMDREARPRVEKPSPVWIQYLFQYFDDFRRT